MNKKKIFSRLIVLQVAVLCCVVFACSKDDDNSSKDDDNSGAPSIVGTWRYDFRSDGSGYQIFQFNADGKCYQQEYDEHDGDGGWGAKDEMTYTYDESRKKWTAIETNERGKVYVYTITKQDNNTLAIMDPDYEYTGKVNIYRRVNQ